MGDGPDGGVPDPNAVVSREDFRACLRKIKGQRSYRDLRARSSELIADAGRVAEIDNVLSRRGRPGFAPMLLDDSTLSSWMSEKRPSLPGQDRIGADRLVTFLVVSDVADAAIPDWLLALERVRAHVADPSPALPASQLPSVSSDNQAGEEPSRPRRRVRPWMVGSAVVLVLLLVAGFGLWGRFGPNAASGDLFQQSFPRPTAMWPSGRSAIADVALRDDGYVVQPLDKNQPEYITAPAPTTAFLSDVEVSATATLRSGQGLWGVWCRGVDAAPSDGYLFLISHTAAVQITSLDYSEGTGWEHLNGIDVSQPVTITARCADVPGAPVELTMSINGGKPVLTYDPHKVLGPGYFGITAQPFRDAPGPIATVTFTDFRISRPQ